MDHATPLRARWFSGQSSRPRDVLIALAPGKKGPTLTLHVLDLAHAASRRFEHHEVDWPSLWDSAKTPKRLTVNLQDHGSLEIDKPEAWRSALAAAGHRPGLAQRMQTHWPVFVGVLLIAVLALGVFYRYGTPWAAAQITRYVPLAWETSLSQRAMEQIDGSWLKPSQLPPERQAELRAQFEALLALMSPDIQRYPNYAPHYALSFRSGMGPNAFALPGGTLVMTDELVQDAAKAGLSDDALVGVLAHEIGHVAHRHGTRLVVEQGVLQIGLGLALGDVSSIVSFGSTLLTGLAYRRQHETESDCFAVTLMARAQRPTAPMAELLLGLSGKRSKAAKEAPEQDAARDDGHTADWFSTHPGTPQRAELLKAGAAPACGH